MSKREVQSVQRKYERDGLHEGVRLICKTQSGKEPSVLTRTSNILEKYGFEQEAKLLRGGKFINCFLGAATGSPYIVFISTSSM